MSLLGLSYFDYIYIGMLIVFVVFFGVKGATKSISYSLKVILSISLPFIFYKRILNFSLEKLNVEYLFSLQKNNTIFRDNIFYYYIFNNIHSILFYKKVLNLKSPSQLNSKF